MNKKVKYYHLYERCFDADNNEHIVTIVAKVTEGQVKADTVEKTRVKNNKGGLIDGLLIYPRNSFNRKVELGVSICHPNDDFDEEFGVELAKSRINHGDIIGTIETPNVSMLTEKAVMALILVELNYLCDHINWRLLD